MVYLDYLHGLVGHSAEKDEEQKRVILSDNGSTKNYEIRAKILNYLRYLTSLHLLKLFSDLL